MRNISVGIIKIYFFPVLAKSTYPWQCAGFVVLLFIRYVLSI